MKGSRHTGLVFDIQRFSVHDGPGIRTTVFMKGCPLRCRWCSNPESQDFGPNLMTDDARCQRCGACVGACPESAIILSPDKGRRIDWTKCDQCLLCAERCLYGGLAVCGRRMGIEEILEEVKRDAPFYRNSGGGVTVSGGEPLGQSDFVADLLEACRSEGFHTCLDTTGYAPWDILEQVLQGVDLLLFDIKHLDPRAHQEMTGVGNELILGNLRRAAEFMRIWLRIPLIAGFNDSREHIDRVARLGKEMRVEKISVLPYHEGGKAKCERMGRPYLFPAAKSPSDADLKRVKEVLEKQDQRVTLGS